MSDRSNDRHKTPRVYKSGFDKNRERKEKQKKDAWETFISNSSNNKFFRNDCITDTDVLTNPSTSTAIQTENNIMHVSSEQYFIYLQSTLSEK